MPKKWQNSQDEMNTKLATSAQGKVGRETAHFNFLKSYPLENTWVESALSGSMKMIT